MKYNLGKLEEIIKYICSKKYKIKPEILVDTYDIDLETAEYLLNDGEYHNTKWLFMLNKFLKTSPSLLEILDCFDDHQGMLEMIDYKYYNKRNINVYDGAENTNMDGYESTTCNYDNALVACDNNNDNDDVDVDRFTYKYRQKECYDKFLGILGTSSYWGMLIAPTGWGKSFMHLLLIGAYFRTFTDDTNVVIVTKRKELLEDQHTDMEAKIKKLKSSDMFPQTNVKVVSYVKDGDYLALNKKTSYRKLIIINSDKIIKEKTTKIDWSKIGFVIFDEMHWLGSHEIYKAMKHIKETGVKFCIGSSATPVRRHHENQKNIKDLMESNILMEISYIDAWANKVIVPVHTVMMKVSEFEKVNATDESVDDEEQKEQKEENDVENNINIDMAENINMDDINVNCDEEKTKNRMMLRFTLDGKQQILTTLKCYLDKVHNTKAILFFATRSSLLEWYRFIQDKKYFRDYTKYVSFSVTKGKNDDKVINMMKKLDINISDADIGLKLFKQQKRNSLAFVVFRGTEGFDDPKVSVCAEMDYRRNRAINLTLQKMGRAQRLCEGKDVGYYLRFVPSESDEDVKKEIVESIKNYIRYVTIDSGDCNGGKINSNMKKRSDLTCTSDIINVVKMFNIDNVTEFTQTDLINEVTKQKTKQKPEKCTMLMSPVSNTSSELYAHEKQYFGVGGAIWTGGVKKYEKQGDIFGFCHNKKDKIELFIITKVIPYNTNDGRENWDHEMFKNRNIIHLSKKISEIKFTEYKNVVGYSNKFRVQGTTYLKWSDKLWGDSKQVFDAVNLNEEPVSSGKNREDGDNSCDVLEDEPSNRIDAVKIIKSAKSIKLVKNKYPLTNISVVKTRL